MKIVLWLACFFLGACAHGVGFIPSSGSTRTQLEEAPSITDKHLIQLAEVDDVLARRLRVAQRRDVFSASIASPMPPSLTIGPGDGLEVSIWEAPPATLFGVQPSELRQAGAVARPSTFPEQMVGADGHIGIPFAGRVLAAGKTPEAVAEEVTRRLQHKANQPQVLVRVTRNATSNVTVVGEVTTSQRMPLTARGERLLDALAASGGVKQPVGKLSVQITRGEKVLALPLDTIIRDPKQNVVLQAGDVLTVLHQSNSFTVLGATGRNEEVNFEAQGISLAQALGRSGGLNDSRADASGVFIFRFEDGDALEWPTDVQRTPEGKVPVVYRADLRKPATFLAAQNFPVKDKDLLYVSNASGAELQKFLNIVLSAAYPVLNVVNLAR